MPTIKLLGWSSRGLRIPDAEIRLENEDCVTPKFTLIQMPNGSGKSAICNLLKLTLSGTAEKLRKDEVKKYAHFLNKEGQAGYFKVDLSVDDETVSYELKFDFNRGIVTCESTFSQWEESEKSLAKRGPEYDHYLRTVFPHCITNVDGMMDMLPSVDNPGSLETFIKLIRKSRGISQEDVSSSSLLGVLRGEISGRLDILGGSQSKRIKDLLSAILDNEPSFEAAGEYTLAGILMLLAVSSSKIHNTPIIIESPSGPLDAQYRIFFAKFLSSSPSQFVGFLNQTERMGFVSELEKSEESIKYFTLIGYDRNTSELSPPLPNSGVVENPTGTLIEGNDYFNAFDGFSR